MALSTCAADQATTRPTPVPSSCDVPVVVEHVGVLDRAGVEGELDLVGPAVAVLGEDRRPS